MNIPETSRILRLGGVKARTGKSTSGIYADMAAGKFPRSVRIGERSVGWLEREIDSWIEAKRALRDGMSS